MRVQLNVLNFIHTTEDEVLVEVINKDDILIENDIGFMKTLSSIEDSINYKEYERGYSEGADSVDFDDFNADFEEYSESEIKSGLTSLLRESNHKWKDSNIERYLPIKEVIEYLVSRNLVTKVEVQ